MNRSLFYGILFFCVFNITFAENNHEHLTPSISKLCENKLSFSSKDLLLDLTKKDEHGLGKGAKYAIKAFDKWSGISEVNKILSYYRENQLIRPDNFWEMALVANKVSPEVFEIPEIYGPNVRPKEFQENRLTNIPQEGPAILDGNHISGFREAIVTAYAAVYGAGRKDLKILGNEILHYIFPEIKDQVLALKIIGPSNAETRAHNAHIMEEAKQWLKDGHVIMRYSAGTVSRLTSNLSPRDSKGNLLEIDTHGRIIEKNVSILKKINHLGIFDPEWNARQGQLILDAPEETKIIPIYSLGRNSNAFYSYGILNPLLRKLHLPENLLGLASLPKEYLKKRNTTVSLILGTPISAKKFKGMGPQKVINYLYTKTYLHAPQKKFDLNTQRMKNPFKKWSTQLKQRKRILPPLDHNVLSSEFDRLMDMNVKIYAQKKGFVSTIVRGKDLTPEFMYQLGLFRNHAFQTVNEGSKNVSDIDEFDQEYFQQIIWDIEKKQPAAVSRLVNTSEFIERGEQYYTMKLFGIDPKLHEYLPGDVLDVGRTAIGIEYRNGKSSVGLLDLNFKSIAAFLYENPSIIHAVGCVSFSSSYSPVALQISEKFLTREFGPKDVKIKSFVHPPNPYTKTFKYLSSEVINEYIDGEINGLSEKLEKLHPYSDTIKHIQLTQPNIKPELVYPPSLVRPYIVKFNTDIVAASMDKSFGSLDFLVLTDLRTFTDKDWKKLFGPDKSVDDYRIWQKSYLSN
ncbi:MAG: GNAT family N-acetyltransferase [Halobacteriovoraceae bacterium]|nr:GNAT family N-acetyltransferase [Halobacteriovoraceae bacterium]